MATQEQIDELKAKNLCYNCVGEEYFRVEIRREGRRRRCAYCGKIAKAYSIDEVAERIELVFDQHYFRTSDQPNSWQYSMLSDKESNYDWERDGEPVIYAIMNSADIPEQAAEDIQQILDDKFDDFESAAMGEETEFSSDSYYEEKETSDERWQEEWNSFEQTLKTEARFFSSSVELHLKSVFSNIDKMRDEDGRPLIIEAGPNCKLSSLFRARVFQSNEKLEAALCRPDSHLGSPPYQLATAGRMNAGGISVFYGANNPVAAIAEVRPPVGSQVAVARFEIIRPLKLLDLTAVSGVSESGSLFDPKFNDRLERAMFLRSLSQRITRPVMPDDELFQYLPTQAVADFLATRLDVRLDGIIFASAQAAGGLLNVVLFHKAARVEVLEIPRGTEISARTGHQEEDEWEADYEVIEEVPPPTEEKTDEKVLANQPDLLAFAMGPWEPIDPDARESTLRIDTKDITVHIIDRVKFESRKFPVSRKRWVKRDIGI